MQNKNMNKNLDSMFESSHLTKSFILNSNEMKHFEQLLFNEYVYLHRTYLSNQQTAYQIAIKHSKDSKRFNYISIYRTFDLNTCKTIFDLILKIINPILNEIKFRNLSKLSEYCESIIDIIDFIQFDGWTLSHVCVYLNLYQLFTHCLRLLIKNSDTDNLDNKSTNSIQDDLNYNHSSSSFSNLKNRTNSSFKLRFVEKIKRNQKQNHHSPKANRLKQCSTLKSSLLKEKTYDYLQTIFNEINQQTINYKLTPLHLAIKNKNLNLVKQLVRFNIDYVLTDSLGNNVFHYAASIKTSKEILSILIRNCSQNELIQAFSTENHRFFTPFHVACYTKSISNIKEIMQIELPLKIYIITNNEKPSLNQREQIDDSNLDKLILFTSKQINSFSDQELFLGGTPLHWCDDSTILAQLLQIGFIKYVNIRNINQETALHVIVRLNCFRCAIILFCCGEILDLTGDYFGNTPLHLAVQKSNFNFVKLLIVFGDEQLLNAVNKHGYTARHLSAKNNNEHQKNILYALHIVGALRCGHSLLKSIHKKGSILDKLNLEECSDGCSLKGQYNGNKFYRIIDDTLEYWYMDYNLKCLKEQIYNNCKAKLINKSNLEINVANKEKQTKKNRKPINLIKSYLRILSGRSYQTKSNSKNYKMEKNVLKQNQSNTSLSEAKKIQSQDGEHNEKCSLVDNNKDEIKNDEIKENNLYSFSEFLSSKISEKESLINIFKNKKGQNSKSKKNRILCIDGGGIKGLFIVQILIELESRLKHPLKSYFNWFCGTSTGSFIATLLCLDYQLSDIRTLYFLIKNKVFKRNSYPYDAKILESYLKKYLGNRTMSSIRNCKLTITSTLFDRSPIQLHLFRNYPSPNELLNIPIPKARISNQDKTFKQIPTYKKQKLWEACRASSAAPYYFKPYGSFCDGGILSNCPTADIITEHFFYNDIKRVIDQPSSEQEKLELIVSLGCGEVPVNDTVGYDCDFTTTFVNLNSKFKKWLLYARQLSICKSFIEMLVSEITNTEHHKHRRTLAWCRSINVPYFRISPTMTNKLKIDERQDEFLINGLWEAKAYMFERKEMINELVNLLELYYEENIYHESNNQNQVITLNEDIPEYSSLNEPSVLNKNNVANSDNESSFDEENNFTINDILSDFSFF